MSNEVEITLEDLKAQADELGIKYHHKAGAQKIQEAIDDHLREHGKVAQPEDSPAKKDLKDMHPLDPDYPKIVPMTSEEYRASRDRDNADKVRRQVRCRITCMNPMKRSWDGEIISVGSRKYGQAKKFIPFDGREWHIPVIMYGHLKERKCTVFYNGKDARGKTVRKPRLIDEFAIEVLEPLTPKEIQELAKQQALADGNLN